MADSTAAVEPPQHPRIREQRRAQRLSRYEGVMRLQEQGGNMHRTAAQMGVERQTVRRHLNRDAFPEVVQRRKIPSIRSRPSPARAACLLLRPAADLTVDEHDALAKMQEASGEIGTAHNLAQDSVRMVRERTPEALTGWIERAAASCSAELGSFANGLQRDIAAVTAGLSLPWSNGQVEGQISRLKVINRSRPSQF